MAVANKRRGPPPSPAPTPSPAGIDKDAIAGDSGNVPVSNALKQREQSGGSYFPDPKGTPVPLPEKPLEVMGDSGNYTLGEPPVFDNTPPDRTPTPHPEGIQYNEQFTAHRDRQRQDRSDVTRGRST